MNAWIPHIPIIDTHLHLWDIHRLDYPWLDAVPPIKKSFLIDDYEAASAMFPVEKLVFVQCECRPEQCLEEVTFVMEQAFQDTRIKGIVAYAPLEQGKAVTSVLNAYKDNALVKGIRRMYDDDPSLCYASPFLDALNILPAYNLTFDISVKPHALAATLQMIKACPDTVFILDHLGKPDIKGNSLTTFERNIDALAALPNVVAKVSGLVTEADWNDWTVADLRPYITHAIQAFGFKRLMFGGDWPVVLLAGTYERWLHALQEVLQGYSREDVHQLFYATALDVYRLQ